MKRPKITRFSRRHPQTRRPHHHRRRHLPRHPGRNVIQSLLPQIKALLSAGRKRGYSLEQTVVAAASALMILLRDSDQTNVYAETIVYDPASGRKLIVALSATEIEEVYNHAN